MKYPKIRWMAFLKQMVDIYLECVGDAYKG